MGATGHQFWAMAPLDRHFVPRLHAVLDGADDAKDVELLTQWIDWAFAEAKAALPKAA